VLVAGNGSALAWQKFSKQVAGYAERSRGGPQSCATISSTQISA
jgi:hypothetical protein